MKKTLFTIAQLSLLVLCLIFGTAAHAQKTNTWKGGTSGHENDWHCAKNWSANRIPDEFSNVVIPDVSTTTQAPPVLQQGRVEINTLLLDSNALLTLEKGTQLVVYGSATGLENANLRAQGSILLPDLPAAPVQQSSASVDSMPRR